MGKFETDKYELSEEEKILTEWTNSEWREACIWGALMLYWVAVGEVEGEVGREVVVDESVEFDRWLGLDDFEDEEEPTEIF